MKSVPRRRKKYFYNPKIDNFEYDKKYLKEMMAQVDELKIAKKEAILLAKLKAEQEKKIADLAIGLLLNNTTYDVKWTSNADKKFGITIGSQARRHEP